MQIREWYPPSRPKLRELGDLLKKGWVFTGGYLETKNRLVFGHEDMSRLVKSAIDSKENIIIPMVGFQMKKD